MGFLDGFGRFIAGKPVFQDGESVNSEPVAKEPRHQTDSFGTLLDEHGYKIIPEIEVDDVRTRRNGDEMEVTAWVSNKSEQQVRIDYCLMVGQKRVLNYELTPHQAHELVLYDGHIPNNNAYHRAELIFRLSNGDQFDCVYYVTYHEDRDGKFLVNELHNDGPVRDI